MHLCAQSVLRSTDEPNEINFDCKTCWHYNGRTNNKNNNDFYIFFTALLAARKCCMEWCVECALYYIPLAIDDLIIILFFPFARLTFVSIDEIISSVEPETISIDWVNPARGCCFNLVIRQKINVHLSTDCTKKDTHVRCWNNPGLGQSRLIYFVFYSSSFFIRFHSIINFSE